VTEKDAPKIEFPCPDYPVKVMGEANDEMTALVMEVMTLEAPGFDRQKITVKGSSKGRFQSITVFITATGVPQLERIHQTLVASPLIKLVL